MRPVRWTLAAMVVMASSVAPAAMRAQEVQASAPAPAMQARAADSAASVPVRPIPAAADASALRPGDIVRLKIWREPDMSGDFPVDEKGLAVLPGLGPVQVAELAPDALRQEITRRYSAVLRNPSVDVIPLRRVKVLGAVKEPGLYPVDATMTLSDVLALAGGALPNGQVSNIQIMRDGRRVNARLSEGMRVADTPVESGDQIVVPARSGVLRNPGIVPAIISGAFSLLITLAITRK